MLCVNCYLELAPCALKRGLHGNARSGGVEQHLQLAASWPEWPPVPLENPRSFPLETLSMLTRQKNPTDGSYQMGPVP